jgi:hypothetical protein
MRGTPIQFVKGAGQRYRSVLDRRDGVRVELDGGGYNQVGGPARRVPHDLAHFIVEDELVLPAGLWGVLAAGGLFAHTTVVAGRQPPHAARRAQAVVDAASGRLAAAELLVRAVADLALAGRPRDVRGLAVAVGERGGPVDVSPGTLEAACRRLQDAGVAWAALPPGGTLDVAWRHPPPRR